MVSMRKFIVFFSLLLALFASSTHLLSHTAEAVTITFDGSDDEQRIDNPNVGSAAWTVCQFYFMSSWAEGSFFGYGLGSSRGFAYGPEGTANTFRLRIQGSIFAQFAGGGSGAWHSLCITRSSGGSLKWWHDATDATADQTDSDGGGMVNPNSTDEMYIGTTIPSDPAGWDKGVFRTAHVAYWNTDLTGAQIASYADKSTCPTSIAGSNLKLFLKETDSPRIDSSSSAFTVVESGSPGTAADPGGLPCGAGAADNLPQIQAIGED